MLANRHYLAYKETCRGGEARIQVPGGDLCPGASEFARRTIPVSGALISVGKSPRRFSFPTPLGMETMPANRGRA